MREQRGARHLAESSNWSAWQRDEDLKRLESEAQDILSTRVTGSTLAEAAAMHDGMDSRNGSIQWLVRFRAKYQTTI